MQTIRNRAEAGAHFLDRQCPGWPKKVNPDILDLDHPRKCVLGQLYGRYHKGFFALGLGVRRARRLGFTAKNNTEFRALTRAWKKVIADRLRRRQSGNGKVKTRQIAG